MKRLFTWLISLFAFCSILLVPIQADNTEYVIDEWGVLSEQEMSQLNALAASYSQAHDTGLYIRVYDDYYLHGYSTIEAYAESIYLNEMLDDDCLLLLITMHDRSFDLFASYDGKCHEAFGSYAREKMADILVDDYLTNGNFYGAFVKYLDLADEYLIMAENGTPMNHENDPSVKANRRGLASAITFTVPEIIALFACLGMRSRMKTTGISTEARDYIADGGIHLTRSQDIFLHRTQTRTHIPRNTGGGGGGHGHSSSGSFGSHTSGHF